MDRYAVIGHPVAHSKSPRMHAQFARQTGQSLSYDAVEVEPEVLPAALQALHEQGYRGLNVTLPHKLAVMALCEAISARAQIAGAVNTLIRTDDSWRGDNTDGEGFIRDLHRLGFGVAGRRVLVLGAGGAVRGILEPLLRERPAELVVSNRNPWKPETLAGQFKDIGTISPAFLSYQILKQGGFEPAEASFAGATSGAATAVAFGASSVEAGAGVSATADAQKLLSAKTRSTSMPTGPARLIATAMWGPECASEK